MLESKTSKKLSNNDQENASDAPDNHTQEIYIATKSELPKSKIKIIQAFINKQLRVKIPFTKHKDTSSITNVEEAKWHKYYVAEAIADEVTPLIFSYLRGFVPNARFLTTHNDTFSAFSYHTDLLKLKRIAALNYRIAIREAGN